MVPFVTAGYVPSTTAVASSLPLTALLGLLPLVLFFVLLGVFKVPTHWCAVASLVTALLVAVFGFNMPADLSLLSATQGAAFGFLPILYIVIMAVWIYNLTERSGRSEDVRMVFSVMGKGDQRVQALLIGFCFCGLLEGLAGFGAPVAIACAMLLAIGIPPVKAALIAMVGNALNVGFGAMAIPVATVAQLGDSTPEIVASTMGRITPFFLVWVPILLLAIYDGIRGVKQCWPPALVAGIGMAGGHFVASNYVSYTLTAVFASLLSFILVALFMQIWSPTTPESQKSEEAPEKLTVSRTVLGLMPYWLVIVIFGIAKLWTIGVDVPAWLASTDIHIEWPGLYGNLLDGSGAVSENPVFNLQWLSSPGTMLLLTGLVVSIAYGVFDSDGKFPFSFSAGSRTLGRTFYDLRITILTIAVIMALAYVMNFSGQTVAIGTWLAGTGASFAFLSPILGWIGTAVTGSATSAAALFANLQATAASAAHLSPQLLLAANEIGGGIGKIMSPQNLAIAATAIKEPGSEATLLRKAAPYSISFVVILGVIVLLASRGTLGFVIAS